MKRTRKRWPSSERGAALLAAPFYGVISAPNAAFTVSDSQTIYGAMVVKSATFSSTTSIHYDVSLRNEVIPGIVTPFAISEWRETTNGS